MPSLATLCRTNESGRGNNSGWLTWVAPPYLPYAPALAAFGIDIRRVLIVHAAVPAEWAMEQALRSEACSAVLGWSDPHDKTALRRLQLAAEQSRCLAVLFRPTGAAKQPSPAVLRIELQTNCEGLQVRIVKSRGGRPVCMTLPRAH